MSVTFKQLKKLLPFLTNRKENYGVLLRGKHGIGKSQVVKQFASEIGLEVVERRASQLTEGDLLGLPKVEGVVTTWLPPDWLYKSCQEPVCLFIDEIDRATQEVRQGFFQLLDSRSIAGWTLHEGTKIFAAINGGENSSSHYQVGELDPAELDRWTVFDVEPDVEDWLSWGKDNNINKAILSFINENRNHLEHAGEFEPGKVYPSRRSWVRFSEVCNDNELIHENYDAEVIIQLSQSFVGLEASLSFIDFLKNYKFQVKPEQIIDEGKIELTEKFDVNEHLSLIEKINDQGWLSKKLSKKQLENLGNYFLSLPSEIAVKLFSDIAEKEVNLAKFHYETCNGKILEKVVLFLANAEVEKEKNNNNE